jgi:hypothetical protein
VPVCDRPLHLAPEDLVGDGDCARAREAARQSVGARGVRRKRG